MSFANARQNDPRRIDSGERHGSNQLILTTVEFEDGLRFGRFAKWDSDQLDNMDGSADPVIAGVVLRNVANAVEDGETIDADLFEQVDYLRQGLVTVEVRDGETPSMFDRVFVSNDGDANDGMATADATDEAVNAEFIAETRAGVWLIYVNPAPGDIAAHTGDTDGAHAASAISVADSAGLTANDEVEAVLAELLPATSRVTAAADPGDTNAIPVDRSANVALTSGASGETRTLADPGSVGIVLDVSFDVDGGGDVVITAASGVNVTGNNTITLANAGEHIRLASVQVAGSPVWRVIATDGAALSTV